MELEQSSLWREVEAITGSSSKPVHYTWWAEIHVLDQTYQLTKVLSVDFTENYETKYTDEIMLTCLIPGGTYAKRVYPNQGKLEITLYRVPLMESSDTVNQENTPQSERYTATLVDMGNPLIEANGSNSPDENALNLTNLFEIEFQLVNKAIEQMRMISVGGTYRNVLNENVLKAVLTTESAKVDVEGVRTPKGVDMVPSNNQKERAHVVIPQGIPLVDVPEYLQWMCGGLYSSGLGYYYQNDYWYVYPCYDTTRFNNATQTLTVINVPKNKMPDIERTYRNDGNNLMVLATGNVSLKDGSEVQQLNAGNGVRFANADNFMSGFGQVEGNKVYISRGANNNEFVSENRPNGNNLVRVSDNAIHSNPYVEYSKLARRQGSLISLEWQNSLPSLLYPGMMAKILFLDGEEIKELYGVLLKAHHYVQLRGKGLTETRYVTTSGLFFFITRPRDTNT